MVTKVTSLTDAYSELEQGIKNNQLVVHYQSQVTTKTNKIYGFEALVRWNHPSLGLLYPDTFIPLAETSGLIVPLGEWVLVTACKQAKLWQELYKKPISIAVNISIEQFSRTDLFETVENALIESGLDSHYLELELTESVMVNTEVVLETIKKLKKIGIKVSIDDFGKGYSSLYYLKEFPVDKLKIDRAFVMDMKSYKNKTIVRSIISMARRLNIEILAEGIETKEQMKIFSKRCDYLQGFYLGKPLPVVEIEHLFKGINEGVVNFV